MILLSLASRQIWPQVISVLHARPDGLVLFHTAEQSESKGPAERLKSFFAAQGILADNAIKLVPVPHDSFRGVLDAIADVAAELSLDDSNCQLNLTGGNKLMAMAASEWCRLANVRCFYLERNLRVFPFEPRGGDLLPQPDFKLDPHLARALDPLALLRCQLDAAEIVAPGQRLLLNQQGKNLAEAELVPLARRGADFSKFLTWDVPETKSKPGFGLEFATAVCLLKLGVPVVQRSVCLRPRVFQSSGRDEGELDLVFNWAGKLWVVDCKDRVTPANRVDRLRTELTKQITITKPIDDQLKQLAEELEAKEIKPLKEDLLAVSEVGGLLGRAICVRRSPLPTQAAEFARSRNLAIVMKDRLLADLRLALFPNQPATLEQLQALTKASTAARC